VYRNFPGEALVALWLLCAPVFGAGQADDSIARERLVRQWALSPVEHELDLKSTIGEGPWSQRARALESIRRSLAAGVFPRDGSLDSVLALVPAEVEHEHANVRAAALEAMALWPQGFAPLEKVEARVRGESLPLVRLAWVHYLTGRGDGAPVLAVLAQDSDREVAHEALRALLACPRRDEARIVAVCADLVAKGDHEGLLELALACERNGATPKLLIDLSTQCENGFGADVKSKRAWAAVFHATLLRLHHFLAPHGLAFPHVIISGWLGDGHGGLERRGLMLRAARFGGTDLAQALTYAAIEAADADRGEYLDGLVETLDAQSLADGAHTQIEFGTGLRLMLWDRLIGRGTSWNPETTASWLTPKTPLELRTSVVAAIADTFADNGDEGSAELLVGVLADPDASLAFDAFSALCDAADPGPWLEALHATWSARDDEAKWGTWLEQLPRGPALVPFRAEFLAAAEARLELRGTLAELLASFSGDGEIEARLGAWLEDELRAVSSLSADDGRAVELRASSVVRALHRALGPDAVEALWSATESVVRDWREADQNSAARDACVGIGKLAVALVGRSEAGRSRIGALLAEDVPRRLRIEAALALAPIHAVDGDPDAASWSAVVWLTQDYAACDDELKTRILRTFGQTRDEPSFLFLRSIVGDGGSEFEDPGELTFEISEAIDSIGKRCRAATRDQGVVFRLAENARDPDVKRAAIEELGKIGGDKALDKALSWLAEHFDEVGKRLDDRSQGDLAREFALAEHQATLTGLAHFWRRRSVGLTDFGPGPGSSGSGLESVVRFRTRRWLFALPDAASKDTLEDRFLAKKLAAVDFSWRAELEVSEALAHFGNLLQMLGAEALWRFDARLLLQMGHRAATVPVEFDLTAAHRLLAAGQIALAGEAQREDIEELDLNARLERFRMAEQQDEWSTCAGLAEGMLADWRVGRLSARVFRRTFGDFDPRRGEDGGARLESAALQARAHEAAAAGTLERARELAQAARKRLGFSHAALMAQKRLERRLAREN
jgi:hypothetical protein